jgi:hypothetical protein
LLQDVIKGLGFGRILWNGRGNGKWTKEMNKKQQQESDMF